MKKTLAVILFASALAGCTARDSYALRYFGGGVALGGTGMIVAGSINDNNTVRNSGIGLAGLGVVFAVLSLWSVPDNFVFEH